MAELLQNPEALSKATSRDESTWDHAHSFMPKRFLGSEVDFIGRNFKSIPFGAGRRICPDLPLDITMLYPLRGSLSNSFDWKLDLPYGHGRKIRPSHTGGSTTSYCAFCHLVPYHNFVSSPEE
ncbi:hypothetical protein CISIN_1g038789mg [Citrus sinensis]|uniref:Cytochrome P450 n=1 Tax=Citrus sinensis TaxID=2711 RepID=A0A067DHP6_CITSI|nr:hypothetical protein CISIN_1g038789mg [Citrus sinensis]